MAGTPAHSHLLVSCAARQGRLSMMPAAAERRMDGGRKGQEENKQVVHGNDADYPFV
jgi:hypothetical protein